MAIVCFDTHVLIWGVKRQASTSQQAMIKRAEVLIQQCEERNDIVIVPAIVVGEVLCNLPPERQAAMFEVLNEAFIIAPYDTRAALHNARVWQAQSAMRQGLRNQDRSRQAIKADIMILSTALAYGCETLYTQDKGLAQIAEKYLRVVKISEVVIPPQEPDLGA